MRERPETVGGASAGEEVKRKRIDLSVPQVAGSAVAAVVAAKLASYFGVYGTILGAGLVSVVATCGGSLFQHFFSRTGEQLREAQVRDAHGAQVHGAQVHGVRVRDPQARDPRVAARPRGRTPLPPGEFTEGTVHRARSGRRKRPVVAAALVFGVAMAGITTYELVSGDSFSGDRGTTVSGAVTGGGSSSGTSSGSSGGNSGNSEDSDGTDSTSPTASPSSPATPSAGASDPSDGVSSPASGSGEDSGDDTGGGATDGTAPAPTATEGGTGADDPATPAPTGSATTPEPFAGSRSGTDDQDPAGPAAP
ncbi:hypothetical protein [Streptomyces maremycinicus]|uniref:hypothetical protein n=1 Tax=Streptomyces maremycinicus TaxID=1679753 RepID=UPI000787B8BC|nr:hypothetical protein [Streptomyces sp. NBRC 110468]